MWVLSSAVPHYNQEVDVVKPPELHRLPLQILLGVSLWACANLSRVWPAFDYNYKTAKGKDKREDWTLPPPRYGIPGDDKVAHLVLEWSKAYAPNENTVLVPTTNPIPAH